MIATVGPLRGSGTTDGDALVTGIPASGGRATGPVRVIREPAEFGALRSGDVLVCPYTNPSWTPLFQRAAAVVVDSGGIGSHAAIVAREYGIPAVMATGDRHGRAGRRAARHRRRRHRPGHRGPDQLDQAGLRSRDRRRTGHDRPPDAAPAARARAGRPRSSRRRSPRSTESGYARLSMERVAERARASKASLYRRWPSKVELVMDAIYHVLPDPAAAADTGSLRGDLLAVLRAAAEQLAGPAARRCAGMLSDALRRPGAGRPVPRLHPRHQPAGMREIVRRAVARGELDAEAITPRQLEAGLALMRYHFLTQRRPIPDQVIVEIVDEVVLPLLHAAAGREGS